MKRMILSSMILSVFGLTLLAQSTNYTINLTLTAKQQAGLQWIMQREGSTNTAQVFLRQRLLSVMQSYASQARQTQLEEIRAKFERLSTTNQLAITAQIEAVLPPVDTNAPSVEP